MTEIGDFRIWCGGILYTEPWNSLLSISSVMSAGANAQIGNRRIA